MCQSALYNALECGVYAQGGHNIYLYGVAIPPLVIADAAYSLKPWLMKAWTCALDGRKRCFNYRITKCRRVTECALGRLKRRWRCLATRLEIAEENIFSVVAACVVLHNICDSRGEILDTVLLCSPQTIPAAPSSDRLQVEADCEAGKAVRNALADHFWAS